MATEQKIESELTEEEKKAIDDCIPRSGFVWSVIKEIAIKKYDNYLEAVSTASKQKKDLDSVKERWLEKKGNETARSSYLNSEKFDDDLSYILKAVGQRLHGLSTKKMNIAAFLKNWRKNRYIDRKTAFSISVGFGFDIEETRKLLYSVLSDDEQYDFDPRLLNEMIYLYAINHNIPLTSKNKNDVSVEKMLSDAQKKFLSELFGSEYSKLYSDVIKAAGNTINVLDSLNMTKLAYILVVIKLEKEGKISSEDKKFLLENTAVNTSEDDFQEDDSDSKEDNVLTAERMPKLFPDDTVMQRCYEYSSYYSENGHIDYRPSKEPNFDDAQTSIKECKNFFRRVVDKLEESYNQLEKSCNRYGKDTEEAERKKELYKTMKQFLKDCLNSVENTSDNDRVSIIDFLPLLENSDLGEFRISEFNYMLDSIIRKEQSRFLKFFFNTLKVAFRDLNAITARKRVDLWPVYVEMNNILKYPYFDERGVATKIWGYEEKVKEREESEYTYTFDNINRVLSDAENTASPSEYISLLLEDHHCYEYFNNNIISQGKEKFVSKLEDYNRIIMYESDCKKGADPLFIIEDSNSLYQKKCEPKYDHFYDHNRFKKQYFDKSEPFKRRDILKLAFWDWILDKENKQKPLDVRVADFVSYFDFEVAKATCCSPINTNNSLDKFLLLCLEKPDPIQFLKKAYAYKKNELRKIF